MHNIDITKVLFSIFIPYTDILKNSSSVIYNINFMIMLFNNYFIKFELS